LRARPTARVSSKVIREAHKAGNRITVYLLRESQGQTDDLIRVLKKIVNHQAVIIAGTELDHNACVHLPWLWRL
jgi:hypothetical protein